MDDTGSPPRWTTIVFSPDVFNIRTEYDGRPPGRRAGIIHPVFRTPSAVDLIAMTTHRRIGPSGLEIGSIAVDVMREAILPTLLVRADSFRHNVESNVSELMT